MGFGGGGSPLVWGRATAFLGRSGQSFFSEREARIEIYVDDPWSAWRGTLVQRRRNKAILLLWWLALGLDVSWHKMCIGHEVKWIGASISTPMQAEVAVAIPEGYAKDLAAEAGALLSMTRIPERRLRRTAGRASWAAGIVPFFGSMIAPLWAALADLNAPTAACKATHGRVTLRPRESQIPVVRVAHALRWLVAYSRRQRGSLTRRYSVGQHRQRVAVRLVFDGSPWGYGGICLVQEKVVSWFAEPISKEDIARFKIVVGSCAHQALIECLAILIGVRLWLPSWKDERMAVTVNSDSKAA